MAMHSSVYPGDEYLHCQKKTVSHSLAWTWWLGAQSAVCNIHPRHCWECLYNSSKEMGVNNMHWLSKNILWNENNISKQAWLLVRGRKLANIIRLSFPCRIPREDEAEAACIWLISSLIYWFYPDHFLITIKIHPWS